MQLSPIDLDSRFELILFGCSALLIAAVVLLIFL